MISKSQPYSLHLDKECWPLQQEEGTNETRYFIKCSWFLMFSRRNLCKTLSHGIFKDGGQRLSIEGFAIPENGCEGHLVCRQALKDHPVTFAPMAFTPREAACYHFEASFKVKLVLRSLKGTSEFYLEFSLNILKCFISVMKQVSLYTVLIM